MIRVKPEIIHCNYCHNDIEYEKDDRDYIIVPFETFTRYTEQFYGYKHFFIKCPVCSSTLEIHQDIKDMKREIFDIKKDFDKLDVEWKELISKIKK